MVRKLNERVWKASSVCLGGLLLFFGIIMMQSCIKDDIGEAGNIPGMGNAGGELQAEAYEFHQDLILGTITGYDGTSSVAHLKSDFLEIVGTAQGSGDQVKVELSITNTHLSECRSAWFRAGTVFDVNLSGYQNAILLSPVNICVPPNATKKITLFLYCLNLGMHGSDGDASYEMLGVTTSQPVLDLIELLWFKKVNYEHYLYYPEQDLDYSVVRAKLQDILWIITNGNGEYDVDFINALPDLPEGVFPEYIYDLNVTLPDCWCVDECEVVENSGALSYVAFLTNCTGTPSAEVDENGNYTVDGFTFNVQTNYQQTEGTIKFESISEPALGEDGLIETGIFTFWAPCRDGQITVTTKNKDEITDVVDVNEVGQAIVMDNGFMIEFISVVAENGGYAYTFNVVSDSCPGSNK
ncbi:hypothetical protein [Carboxylicivirga marina]|uniref:hypothetical protein n=1 Tax=Carboxylicivirga marina TaxID=2800988 RepID=UPI0025913E0C|nr:hypothetical protein [uncultured Carboxylicivirga sp.]